MTSPDWLALEPADFDTAVPLTLFPAAVGRPDRVRPDACGTPDMFG